MATLIICPACDTRYQIKAAFPSEGRKVRCAKCGHVWQAHPPGTEAPAPPRPTPAPQAAPQPGPAAPPAAPKGPPPPPPPVPQAAPPPPRAPQPAPSPPPQTAPSPPPPLWAAPPAPPAQAAPQDVPSPRDAEFGTDDALAAKVARINAEAGVPETGAPSPPEPVAEPAKKAGFFEKLMGKRGQPPPPSDTTTPFPPSEDAGFGAPKDAAFGAPKSGSLPIQDASFDAGFPDEDVQDSALADPDLVAAAFGESVSKQKKSRKGLPIVAIGWGILTLIVLIVVGLFAFAPATTVSVLPGASRIYAMLGMPMGTEGLAFEGVRYGWTSDGSQTVLQVQGNVRNTSSAAMAVPTVIIALRDENGDEISEWTTEVGAAQLAAGEEASFLRQIPSPPSNVRSLKVRFADADK